jgi:hypothetical protein
MTVEGVVAQARQTPTPEPPKPKKGALPKGLGQTQQVQQQSTFANDGKSRQEKLADYEAEYLQRIEQQRMGEDEAFDKLLEDESKARFTASRGTLPKGFE